MRFPWRKSWQKLVLNKLGPPPWRRPDLSSRRSSLLCWRRLARLGVLATEPFHASCRVHQALFASEERVAVRADFHVDVALMGRPGLKVVSAGAHHAHRGVVRMDFFLGHLETDLSCNVLSYCIGIQEAAQTIQPAIDRVSPVCSADLGISSGVSSGQPFRSTKSSQAPANCEVTTAATTSVV